MHSVISNRDRVLSRQFSCMKDLIFAVKFQKVHVSIWEIDHTTIYRWRLPLYSVSVIILHSIQQWVRKKIKVKVKKSHLYSFLSLVVVFFSQSVAPVLKSLADNWRNHRIVISCSRSCNFSNQITLPSACRRKKNSVKSSL